MFVYTEELPGRILPSLEHLGLVGFLANPESPFEPIHTTIMSDTRNLFNKVWDLHTVSDLSNGQTQLFIGLHMIHEVTSPQAFEILRDRNLPVMYPDRTIATVDHIVPTTSHIRPFEDTLAEGMMSAIEKNCAEFGVRLLDIDDDRQGIVHVVGPEQGLTQPGMTIVCGDSHTSTHGAFGALAFGIGTSEVEHVLATQTLLQSPSKTMEIRVNGPLPVGLTAKDIILAIIGKIGTAGGTGYVFEYTGQAIRDLSPEGRMTICNMSIEAGARAGLISPDEKTVEYLKGREYLPKDKSFDQLKSEWLSWASDPDCAYDAVVELEAAEIEPQVTWGTSPGMVTGVKGRTPVLADIPDADQRASTAKALKYMGLDEGIPIEAVTINKMFFGSCTNARIEDLRAAAKVVKGHKVHNSIEQCLVVPGSHHVKEQAEQEGLDKIFKDAGFEWREAGCSMCLAMNDDRLNPGDRCASTSNRNFEGRQGAGGRTHLVSPAMAVAAAIKGHFTDIRDWEFN